MKIFIAGIIQGSDRGKGIYSQDYRARIKSVLQKAIPEAEIFCPFEHHPNSIDYDDERGKRVFLDLIDRAARSDVLIAFLPQASLGTAIEIWQAYCAGKIIITISPMIENWVIKFLSDINFETLESFEDFVLSNRFSDFLENHKR